MRLLRFVPGLLLLRWLPFGFVTRWLLRLGLWSGIGYSVYRALKPPVSASKAPQMSYSPSGWAPPVAQSPASRATTNEQIAEDTALEELIEELEADSEAIAAAEALVDDVVELEFGSDAVVIAEAITVDDNGVATIDVEIEAPGSRWVRGDGSQNCPDEFPIKAKASSLIYHTDESRNYDVTTPDVCFATAHDAEAAGYRAPKR